VTVEGVTLANGQPALYNATGGELRIGWTGAAPINLITGEELLTLKLKTASNLPQGETIRFTLAADNLNELADGNGNTIPNGHLTVSTLEGGTGVEKPAGSDIVTVSTYPNPFNGNTNLTFTLRNPGEVTLEVTDILGRRMEYITLGQLPAGQFQQAIDATTWPTGVYQATVRLNDGAVSAVKTVRLISN
jgi:hypothetical protein